MCNTQVYVVANATAFIAVANADTCVLQKSRNVGSAHASAENLRVERLTVLLDFGKVAALMRTHTCMCVAGIRKPGLGPTGSQHRPKT